MNKNAKTRWALIIKLLSIVGGLYAMFLLSGFKFSLRDFFTVIAVILLGLIFTLTITFAVLGSMRLFRKLYPIKANDHLEVSTNEVNTYLKHYKTATGVLILGWLIGGFLSYQVLIWLAEKWFQIFPGVFMAPIERGYWGLPATFIGLLFGCLFSTIVIKLFLRDQYKRFEGFFDYSWGFNSKKAGQLIAYAYLLLIMILIYVGLASYTRFTEEGVYTHRAYSITEEYHPYGDVTNVEERIRQEKDSSDHIFVIDFSDGKQWQTTSIKDKAIPENFSAIMNYVSEKSGHAYKQVTITE